MSRLQKADLLNVLANSYLAKEDTVEQNLPYVLEAVAHLDLLTTATTENTPNTHKWITRLNSLLQSKQSGARWAAISLIGITIRQSPILLKANIGSWSQALLNILGHPEPEFVSNGAIDLMTSLFVVSKQWPEVQREITTPSLPKFLTILHNLSGQQKTVLCVLRSFRTLSVNFPTIFKPFADNTAGLCLYYLDGTHDCSEEILSEAVTCFAALPGIGGKANTPARWRDASLRLLGSLHQCLDTLFATLDEETTYTGELQSYDFPAQSKDYFTSFPILFKRASALEYALRAMLSTQSKVAVNVPIVKILELCNRVLSANEYAVTNERIDPAEYNCLLLGLPKLHLDTLSLLVGLVQNVSGNIVRYASMLGQILLQVLSQNNQRETMRASGYRAVKQCLDCFDAILAPHISEHLVSYALADIAILKSVNAEVVAPVPSSKKGNKRRRTDVNEVNITNACVSYKCSLPSTVQVAALQALESLLLSYGPRIPANQRALVDRTVISRLLVIHQALDTEFIHSEDLEIEQYLYRALLASVQGPCVTQPSVLTVASRLFLAGGNRNIPEVQSICRAGKMTCDILIHSRMPPIPRKMDNLQAVDPFGNGYHDANDESEEELIESEQPITTPSENSKPREFQPARETQPYQKHAISQKDSANISENELETLHDIPQGYHSIHAPASKAPTATPVVNQSNLEKEMAQKPADVSANNHPTVYTFPAPHEITNTMEIDLEEVFAERNEQSSEPGPQDVPEQGAQSQDRHSSPRANVDNDAGSDEDTFEIPEIDLSMAPDSDDELE